MSEYGTIIGLIAGALIGAALADEDTEFPKKVGFAAVALLIESVLLGIPFQIGGPLSVAGDVSTIVQVMQSFEDRAPEAFGATVAGALAVFFIITVAKAAEKAHGTSKNASQLPSSGRTSSPPSSPLAPGLIDEDADVRSRLSALGPEARAELFRLLEAPTEYRRALLQTLSAKPANANMATLIATADTDEVVRLRLLRAIRDLGGL